MVLATDITQHFTLVAQLEKRITDKRDKGEWFSHESLEDRLLCLETLLHCADLGNPTKPGKVRVCLSMSVYVHASIPFSILVPVPVCLCICTCVCIDLCWCMLQYLRL